MDSLRYTGPATEEWRSTTVAVRSVRSSGCGRPREIVLDLGENRVEQRRSACGRPLDGVVESRFRAAVGVGEDLRDAVRVQQQVIALVDRHDRRVPRGRGQHR